MVDRSKLKSSDLYLIFSVYFHSLFHIVRVCEKNKLGLSSIVSDQVRLFSGLLADSLVDD